MKSNCEGKVWTTSEEEFGEMDAAGGKCGRRWASVGVVGWRRLASLFLIVAHVTPMNVRASLWRRSFYDLSVARRLSADKVTN